jgi:hypothetical protein
MIDHVRDTVSACASGSYLAALRRQLFSLWGNRQLEPMIGQAYPCFVSLKKKELYKPAQVLSRIAPHPSPPFLPLPPPPHGAESSSILYRLTQVMFIDLSMLAASNIT